MAGAPRDADIDVSVVIPCYNSAQWLDRSITALLLQSGVQCEIIVVDDGSTDESLETLKKHVRDITVLSNPYIGACHARNFGFRASRGSYVVFHDADDYVSADFLAGQLHAAREENADLVVGQCQDVFDWGPPPRRRRPPRIDSARNLICDWLTGRFVPPCALLWRRGFVEAVGGWNPALLRGQDGDFLLRAALLQPRMARGRAGVASYFHHRSEGRITNNASERHVADSFEVLDAFWANAGEALRGDDHVRRAVSIVTHRAEREACMHGFVELEADIRAFRRASGFPRYDGRITHRVFAALFGLRRKEALAWGPWASVKSAIGLIVTACRRVVRGPSRQEAAAHDNRGGERLGQVR